MGSNGAATAALVGRGNRVNCEDDTGYQIILPPLPKGRVVLNTVFLHGDVRARPYRVEDFRDALGPTGLLPEVLALGAYQINHVWAVTMNNADATKRLLDVKELKVKGRRCIVVDPQDQQVRLRLHWLIHGVADEDVRTALAAFGKVVQVTRERWRVQGISDKGTTTRSVLLKLKSGVKLEDLPHQIRVAGELALVVVPGRPMQCLRCQGSGHVRRECKVPRCSQCRKFGHSEDQCIRTYASATGPAEGEDAAQLVMDVAEAEDAAKGAGDQATPSAAACSPAPAVEAVAPVDNKAADGGAEDRADKSEEESTSNSADARVPMQTVDDPSEKNDATGSNVGASVKRPLEQPAGSNAANQGSSEDGPPSKTSVGWRSSYKPRPNFNTVEKKTDNKPTPLSSGTGPPGGPGGV